MSFESGLRDLLLGPPRFPIANGDFEANSNLPPDDWTDNFINPTNLSWDISDPYEGTQSLVLTYDTDEINNDSRVESNTTTGAQPAGITLTMSCAIRVTGDITAWIVVSAYSGNSVVAYELINVASMDWTDESVTITPPSDFDHVQIDCLGTGGTAGTITLDSFVLDARSADRPLPPPALLQVGQRVYPVLMAEGSELPAIIYNRTSGASLNALDGPAGLFSGHIEISCHAILYADARALAEAVKVLLNGYHGILSDGTVVGGMFCHDVRDMFDDPTRTYRCDVDFEFWIQE
jgi:hypothetical protein